MNLSKEIKTLLSDLEKNEDSVKELVFGEFEDFINDLENRLDRTESPIERLLAVRLYRFVERSHLQRLGDVFQVSNQEEINIDDGTKYRVDFLIEFARQKGYIIQKFIIECDGHDFHERTKKQATRDKERDRKLMDAGYYVIRFTGSEIYKDPGLCAREVLDIITNKVIDRLG